MERIRVEFTAFCCLSISSRSKTVLIMDEEGKRAEIEYEGALDIEDLLTGKNEPLVLPKRVMKAFTTSAIDKILAKDEIPDENNFIVMDGYNYHIVITKGDVTKEYDADDSSIETYPLLRYLASWCRRL